MTQYSAVGQRFPGGNHAELVGPRQFAGHMAVEVLQRVIPLDLGTDPRGERRDIEQVQFTDRASAGQQRIAESGHITAGAAEDAQTGYGDAPALHQTIPPSTTSVWPVM